MTCDEYGQKLILKEWTLDKQIRNSTNNDRFLDWIAMYGEGMQIPVNDNDAKGAQYIVKQDTSEPKYEASLEFSILIREQKKLFTPKCIDYMLKRLNMTPFIADNGKSYPSAAVEVLTSSKDILQISKHNDTLEAMKIGFPLILKPLFHDEDNKMINQPDLLVRRDLLPRFFNNFQSNLLPSTSTVVDAKENEYKYAYDIVYIRWATLEFSKKNYPELLKTSAGRYYAALLNAHARALRNITGHECLEAYVLGRGWKCGKNLRNCHVFDMLGTVSCHQDSTGYGALIKATNWLKKLKTEGSTWQLFPRPSNKYLYPNMKNSCSFPWTIAKEKIANRLKELTLLWQVGHVHRNLCIRRGVQEYDDPLLTTDLMSMPIGKISNKLNKIILANRRRFTSAISKVPHVESSDGKYASILPRFIPVDALNASDANTSNVLNVLNVSSNTTKPIEDNAIVLPFKFTSKQRRILKLVDDIDFSTDFETKSSIDDPMTYFPYTLDTTMIAMIGCGYEHPIKGIWIPKIFKVEQLTRKEEARIIDEWLSHMRQVKEEYKCIWRRDKRNKLVSVSSDASTVSIKKKQSKRKLNQSKSVDHKNNEKNEDDEEEYDNNKFRIFHWSKAEQWFLEYNYNAAVVRHGRNDWKGLINWCDVHQLCKDESLSIPGCFNYSLKSVAKALHKWKCIDDIWLPSPIENGMCATIALLRCSEDAIKNNRNMSQSIWMEELERYLLLDIYTVYSIVKYFRKHHM